MLSTVPSVNSVLDFKILANDVISRYNPHPKAILKTVKTAKIVYVVKTVRIVSSATTVKSAKTVPSVIIVQA